MSEKTEITSKKSERRRTKQTNAVKQAFEDDETVKEEKKLDENPNVNEKEKVTREKSKKRSKTSKKPSSPSDKDDPLKKEFETKQARATFTFNHISVEITLNDDLLSWTTVSGGSTNENNNAAKNNPMASLEDSVRLKDVFAITPVYHNTWNWTLTAGAEKSTASSPSTPSDAPELCGFQMHSHQKTNDSILQEILINFRSDKHEQIEHWFRLLTRILDSQRPNREIIVLCNTYAGLRDSRSIYNTKLKSLLDRANFQVNYAEIHDLCPVDEVLRGFRDKFSNLYALVVLGGDGSVIQSINALIQMEATETRSDLRRENEFPNLPFPICIVGTGTTNLICHSIYGTTDPITSILHLLCNKQMKIDMSAVFDKDENFLTANFAAAAGFPANALKYFSRYSTKGPKKMIQKSFSSASKNKNLKAIPMKIRYIPDYRTTPVLSPCRENCEICNPNIVEGRTDEVLAFDTKHIPKSTNRIKSSSSDQELNSRGASASKKSRNETNVIWKTLDNSFVQASILTNANLWNFAPQGLAKYAHLADGVLSLVLIDSTSRRDFLRYVKRNGNSEDQFEFPFIKLIKAKEVEIELDLPTFDPLYPRDPNGNDVESSLSDDSSNDDEENRPRKSSFSSEIDGRPPRATTNDENDDAARRKRRFFPLPKSKKDSTSNNSSRPSTTLSDEKRRLSTSGTTKNRERRSSIISRSFSIDNSLSNSSTKKSSKKTKTPCMWNLNFTPYNSPVIRIKCFHRYLPVFGAGPNFNGPVKGINYSCF